MASDKGLIEYIAEQMSEAGDIRYRKMFGEYGIYCDDKMIAIVSDNQLFIKITEAGRAFLDSPSEAPPYPGAKNWFLIEGFDNRDFISTLVRLTTDAVPMPKAKKPSKGRKKD